MARYLSGVASRGAGSSAFPGMLTDLSEREKELVEAALRGELLTCSTLDPSELRETTNSGQVIRGQVLRELLLGRHGDLDPRGVQVRGARITGNIDLRHVHAAVGLNLSRCVCDEPVQLQHAHLPWLYLSGTHLPALWADGLRIDSGMILRGGFTATGGGERGAVRLLGADIGRNLEMDGAQLTNTTGPALHADGLRLEGGMILRNGFTATGSGEKGAVRLVGAHIGVTFEMDGAQLTNTTGPALLADGLRVEGGVFLRNGFTATGGGERGAVRLVSTHIGGSLDLAGARLNNPSGELVLDVQGTHTSRVSLPADLICPGGRRSGRACSSAGRRLDIDGFTYTHVGGIDWEQWLHLVRCHTESYRPTPYQQLAAVRTAVGHDRDARQILVAQQQDHRARGDLGGPVRQGLHWVWGALAGYGYRTGRTALALLTVLLLAGGMGWWAGHTSTGPGRYAAEHPTSPGACSPVELIGLGIDRGLPLASTGIRNRCDLDTDSPAGQWFTVAIWILQAAVWALATLALAGYTGLIRKVR